MLSIARYFRRGHDPLSPARMWGRVFDLSKKVRVDLDGFSLHVMGDDYIGAGIIAARQYEPHVTALIRRELRPGQTFLDVGANVGYFSMLARSLVGSGGRVLAFEPNPQNLQLIYASMLANGFDDIAVHPYAASDRAGILPFTTVGSNGGVVTERSVEKPYLLVPAVVIDEILGGEGVDMVKIDVEAHEPFVVRGMARMLARCRPSVITEFHPWAMQRNNAEPPEAYLALLEGLGYRLSVISDDGAEPMSAPGIMAHWRGLGRETAHLDLYCKPI